jgi:[ribosomal protein S5]-alanine N-acetyltransferase
MLPGTFRTARLILRPITPDDCDPIFETYARDAEVTRYLVWRPHESREETSAYIARCMAAPPADARTYVLTSREHRTVLGSFELRQPQQHRLDFGYVLASAWWAQGLMTEVLTEIVRWGLTQDCVFRIGAVCDTENIGSAHVMEKAGLVREGLLRRWLIHPNISDEPRDCFSYARVR